MVASGTSAAAAHVSGVVALILGRAPELRPTVVCRILARTATRYRITAKIGDALSAGRPVLVPEADSVANLHDLPGVFLFDETSFASALDAALGFEGPISLPEGFTLGGACAAFEAADALAARSPRAEAVFGLARPRAEGVAPARNLLLVWKQNDAGLYGRRIDQIARRYKRRNPASRIVALELMHERALQNYIAGASRPVSEAGHVVALSERKARAGHVDADGVLYREIRYRSSDLLRDHLLDFLAETGLNPANAVAILFPIIGFMEKIQDLFAAFPLVVDVVDNQFSWACAQSAKRMAQQYAALLLAADRVVFNSSVNMEHFLERFGAAVPPEKASLISNWYSLPADARGGPRQGRQDGRFHVVYSGNMNDRLDWSLIEMIADLSDEVQVHLVGSAERAGARFHGALHNPNIVYHGVMPEWAVLDLLRESLLAIMPHTANDVSHFMNPLKLHMYAALGIPVATTSVEGITAESAAVSRHPDRASFLGFVAGQLARWREGLALGVPGGAGDGSTTTPAAEQYMRLIASLGRTRVAIGAAPTPADAAGGMRGEGTAGHDNMQGEMTYEQ